MRVVLFRPRQRERKEWVDGLRQAGHDIRFVHDPERIGEAELVVLDSRVERWKEYADWLQEQVAPVVLLVEDKAAWADVELGGMGIAGLIHPDEEPRTWISETKQDMNHEEPSGSGSTVPLSLRKAWRKRGGESTTIRAGDEHSGDAEAEGEDTSQTSAETWIGSIPATLDARFSPPAKRASPSIAAVYAAKGGVGKTAFLLHLAALMAKAGYKVCMLDLDSMHGAVASTLQIYPRHTIADLIERLDRPEAAKGCLIPTAMGFSIVAAPREAGVSIRSPESLPKLFRWLTSVVDMVLIDTSVQWDEITKLALAQVDHLWLMTTDEKASIHGLVRMAPLLSCLCPMPDISIIWNRLAEPVSDDLQDLFPWPIALQLPESSEVAQAIRTASIPSRSRHDLYLTRVERLVAGWGVAKAADAEPRRHRFLRRLLSIRNKRGTEI